ncbi:MAG TPA: UDP-N-acetylmuramoyl-L-alanyl-D-glutamate--2,6-diaminopimelate ligase [Ruminiclostridium sp.]|nr:UDP-N-acetylmuramoyl-L-alanyl-D-glutamate--2,6-diaminopimelate ligase [Ruminiclostridium sp.]
MNLSEFLYGIEYKGEIPDIEITGITSDSRKAGPGTVFVCIKGEKTDGHNYAKNAAESGCAAIISERETGALVPHIIVPDSHSAYSKACANFFGSPASKLKLIGVTGTNGKTTVTTIIKHILEHSGHKTGLIGTIKNMSGNRELPAHYTTPEPYELQSLLRTMADDGCEYCIMEVSSHALAQKRVEGLKFICGVFTNLTQDHLDFHKTMENYLKAKQKLFEMSEIGVINSDDPYAEKILKEAPCKTVTYGINDKSADYRAENIIYRPDGITYDLKGRVSGKINAALPGAFSVYNTLGAVACAVSIGVGEEKAISALTDFKGVKGRIEVVPTGRDFSIIIDYAHTPDGLEKILRAVKGFARGRVVALFGCGGDRDKGKRPKMGKTAADNADFLVITSDNPRTEDADVIIKDILAGLEQSTTPYITITNRREAIEYAIKNARKDDCIVLAGKGHEDYQILPTGRIHFDEREVVAEILKDMD